MRYAIMGCMALLLVMAACTAAPKQERELSELEKRIAMAENATERVQTRPDYLPAAMFSKLPAFPKDFYDIRTLVRANRITDLGSLGEEYWQQPEFFPHFEDTAMPLLLNPPKNRWGAYGIAVYPADSVGTIRPGESLDMFFFVKSGYIVETYQGMMLKSVYPSTGAIVTGQELPGGNSSVQQDPGTATRYLKAEITPETFVLHPNFPIYSINGTKRIRLRITAAKDTPEGNYLVGVDVTNPPEELEQQWMYEYLTAYVGGSMTRIERPYFQAFVQVGGGE